MNYRFLIRKVQIFISFYFASYLVNDREGLTLYCKSSSGDSVDILSGTISTMVVASGWCYCTVS